MTESTEQQPGILRRMWGFIQWLIAIVFGLFTALLSLAMGEGIDAPGAPVAGFYTSIGILALVAVCLSPPIFFRLPKLGKIGSYVSIIAALTFFGMMAGQVQSAYERTPEGAKAAAEREAERKAEEQEDRLAAKREQDSADRQAKVEAEAEAEREVAASMAEDEAKLADCLALFGGGVPDLKDRVKNALHNPDSFEHVETTFLGVSGKNTFMQFRAENGFGAIRSNRVSARVDPDTCRVTELGEFSGI